MTGTGRLALRVSARRRERAGDNLVLLLTMRVGSYVGESGRRDLWSADAAKCEGDLRVFKKIGVAD